MITDLSKLTRQQKLSLLQDKVLDKMIEGLEDGSLGAMDLQTCVTYLKNNKVIEHQPVGETEQEHMDNLVQEVLNEEV